MNGIPQIEDDSSARNSREQRIDDKVAVDRKQLLQILVQVENALEEIKQLRKEHKQ